MKTKIEGLKELDKQLGRLAVSTGKGAVRRALKKGGEPLARKARQNAPTLTHNLEEGIDVSSTARPAAPKQSAVEVYVGPGRDPQAITQEFGTWFHPPQPYMRPAWDATQKLVLDEVSFSLFEEIEKSVNRAAKRGTLK